METGSFHLLVVHRIDYRPDRVATTGDVVVFSEPGFAPTCAAELQLATPGYYRREETLEPGIGDESDGSLTKDASPWLARKLGGHIRNVKASIRLVSAREPWVYCAAHHRDARDLQRLRTRFSEEYGYTAATAILDADDFAMWLGIDFALTFDEAAHVSLGETEAAMLARARYSSSLGEGREGIIDTVVHIHHGPVHYADQSGVIASLEDFDDPFAGPKAWFTKRTDLAWQCEYRFAVGTTGTPVEPRHYIPTSSEMRALTRPL